ncbi:MAG TPA: cupin domain-containing protein [Pseudonocardiaceae bacterium]|jgi:mannose-6-phosphate isomerase-like protein (cupin superfamily)|nr:cupin domain-containing protein [Pseudonocardiaceae bacterium]
MSIAIVRPGEGEIVSAGPMRGRILEDGGRTQHRLGVMELTIPLHVDGPPQHIHHEHEETFYVVSGTPTFTCGTDTITAELGRLVVAPIGAPHTFANPGEVPVIILCTVTPDLYIDYFRELDALSTGRTGLDPRAVAEVMARYATEVVERTLTSGFPRPHGRTRLARVLPRLLLGSHFRQLTALIYRLVRG